MIDIYEGAGCTISASSDPNPFVSIIIPAHREAENLPLLIPQLAEALRSTAGGSSRPWATWTPRRYRSYAKPAARSRPGTYAA